MRKTVQTGHHNIHDDYIKVLALDQFHCLHTVLCLCNLIAFKFCVFLDDQPDVGLVVHDQ